MTRQRTFKIRILSAFSLFVVTLTILVAFAAPAQQADKRQPSAKSSAASLPVQSSTSAQALFRTRLPCARPCRYTWCRDSFSCLLGGKVIRANAYLSPKVKAPQDKQPPAAFLTDARRLII